MIYDPLSRIGWLVALILLVAGIAGGAYSFYMAWYGNVSYLLLGCLFLIFGISPIVRRFRSPTK